MEQTKYVNMLEEAAESLYQKNGARITADRYEGLCLKLLDLKKIPENPKSGVCVWHGSTEMRWQRIPAG